jgi:histidinol-phosphate aminotransferase
MPAPTPRPTIAAMARYQPNLSSPAAGRTIRLSANEGALGPSPKAMQALAAVAAQVHHYPEEEPKALAEAIGQAYGLDPARMVFGCGSDELIQALCHAYIDPGDEVIHTEYGFIMYPMSATVAGGVPVSAPDIDYRISVDAILERVTERTRIVFLANPNNPTGSYLARSEVARLHRELPENVLLVIDAAYAEFVSRNDYSDGSELVEASENVIMLRTFSKLYAMAGLRLGWGYGPQDVINAMHVVKQPFGANRGAVAAAIAAIGDKGFVERSVTHNETWQPWTKAKFEALGLKCLPSVTNFLMVRFPDEASHTATAAGAYLSERGILTRGMAGYGAPEFLRLSIGTEEEMRIVVDAVAEFLNQ